MNLTREQIARMIDISAVKADSSVDEVKSIVLAAKKYRFICVFTLPSLTLFAKEFLAGETYINLGGTVGFPSGASTTSSKEFEAEELLRMGCNELDMVINIGKLKSNLYKDVAEDIKKILGVAGNIPVKVILEVCLLNDLEIQDGAKIVRDSGAQFVKTGTGWLGPTSFEHIKIIKKAVGESIKLKVAGGIRNLDVLLKMSEMGVSRFGIGHLSAINIMNEFEKSSKGETRWEA
jgi:deoxyribose-phosphate aldolase